LKPRQRSEISLSLASVLEISAKTRKFAFSVLPMASAASRRTDSRESCIKLSTGSIASSSPPTLKRRLAMVSSNSRFQLLAPVTDFS